MLQRVVEINPDNWAAHWVIGKTHQALGKAELALESFSRSRNLKPDHPDVAREAAISAAECRRPELAVEFEQAALVLNPDDAGLQPNLALAHLFCGQPDVARRALDSALSRDPEDAISLSISRVIDDVLSGARTCPRHRSEI